MEATSNLEMLERLAGRLDELERVNMRLRHQVAALELRHMPDQRTATRVGATEPGRRDGRTSRKGIMRLLLGAPMAVMGIGALGATDGTPASASGAEGQTTFTSATTSPTIIVRNAGGGTGIHSHGDTGVAGFSTSSTGTGSGIYGYSASPAGYGVFGLGDSASGTGVAGHGAIGIQGTSTNSTGAGVLGIGGSSGIGVRGVGGIGINGESTTGTAVNGVGILGVFGISNSSTGTGVRAYAQSSEPAMATENEGSGPGLSALSFAGPAVLGISDTAGVSGQSGSDSGRGGTFAGSVYGAQLQLVPTSAATHPSSGQAGDLFVDVTARLWYCSGGTRWTQLA